MGVERQKGAVAERFFRWDERLGIPVPVQEKDWLEYSEEEQEEILYRWEKIRGKIPDRIKEIERELVALQDRMFTEEDFDVFCEVVAEAAERASRVNSLNIWFRTEPSMALAGEGMAHSCEEAGERPHF